MTTSVTGGALTFNYNTFMQRGLCGLDIPDPAAFRAALGVSASGTALPALTLGAGLTGTAYDGSAPITATIDSSSTGTANKITKYTASGDVAVNSQVLFGGTGTAFITRTSAANNPLTITNTGTGALSLQNGAGLIQLVAGGSIDMTSATSGSFTTTTGTTITTSVSGTPNQSLLVTKGTNTTRALKVVGGAEIDSFGTAPTFSAGATIASGQALSTPTIAGGPSFSGGLTVPSGQTLTASTIAGGPSFSGGLTVPTGQSLIADSITTQVIASQKQPCFSFINFLTSVGPSSFIPLGDTCALPSRGTNVAGAAPYLCFYNAGRVSFTITINASIGALANLRFGYLNYPGAFVPIYSLANIGSIGTGSFTFTVLADLTGAYSDRWGVYNVGTGTYSITAYNFSGVYIG